ncbi:hypothetical protein CMV_022981 [Castanea mollissima]|uniref:Transcription factor n=1 Tax=Castanea mollissima TaxID=60419 RepID=A0A8J4VB40_9ROSI|nr:hypothetical protein CMV_022981 [Castanea mollissima]
MWQLGIDPKRYCDHRRNSSALSSFLKNQSVPDRSICKDTRMSHSPPSIPSIFPAKNSWSGSSASTEMDQMVPEYCHSLSSIFPPNKSTESSESNERHPQPQFSNSISSIFPPNKSTESSESNERPPQQFYYSTPSIFTPNESTNSAGSPSKLSIQSESNNQLQAALQKLIEEVRHSWTYAIMWDSSYDNSGMPILRWADGYYKGNDDYHVETNNRTEKPLSVVLEEQEVLASATDEEDFTNTEWFFLKSKTQCFLNGSGLPGQAFVTSKLVWVAGLDHLATSTCNRARMGQASGLQTMVWLPSANGIVELGSTMLIFQSTDMINKIVMGKPNQLRGGEHDVLTQDDSFEEIYQMLATLPPMTEKHQACASEQQNQGGASPTLPPTPRDIILVLFKRFQDEASKCRRFYEGLRKGVRSQIIPSMLRDFTVLVEQAKVVEKNCDHTQIRESKRMRFAPTLQ